MAKLVTLVACFFVCGLVTAETSLRPDDADVKKLEGQVEKLLEAYNKDDVKAFFANWASSVKSIATEQTYKALYKDGAKKDLGEYTTKTAKFRKEGSVVRGENMNVYFEAQFAKSKSGLVTANFTKEKGEYKFIQVKMEKQK